MAGDMKSTVKNNLIKPNKQNLNCKFNEPSNKIQLIYVKWTINQRDISLIISDDTTVFASLRNVIGTKNTTQCRKMLGLTDDVDLAVIFIITMCNTRFVDEQVVTNWIGSDLQESSIKIVIRGELTPELKDVGIGSVCAILNPNMKDEITVSDLKSITIKRLDDILVIGQVDGLTPCKGITTKGEMCKNLVYTHNQGDYCKYHIKFANKKNSNRLSRVNNGTNKTGNSDGKSSYGDLSRRDVNKKLLEARLGERMYFEGGKPYTLVERPKPVKPYETIAKLGSLNHLMQKVMKDRTAQSLSASSSNSGESYNRVTTVNNQHIGQTPKSGVVTSNNQVDTSKDSGNSYTTDMSNVAGTGNKTSNTAVEGSKTNNIGNKNTNNVANKSNLTINNKVARPASTTNETREFESLSNLIKQYITKDPKECNNMLNALQLMIRKVSGVSNEVIRKTQIMKVCEFLLDHPEENVALSALRLRRAIRKYNKTALKDGEYVVTRLNTGIGNERLDTRATNDYLSRRKPGSESNKELNRAKNKETVIKELDSLINLTSKVEAVVDKEKGKQLTERLKNIEKMDKTEEFKLTIKFLEVEAYHCRECDMWYEHVNNYCKRENHTLNKKRVKKEYHICINKGCNYRYYSLNGQKPSRCPKCKQTTVVSQKTSFYKPRPDYLMPNEVLAETESGRSRPLDCDS
ncbi:uncharacterized protein TOT_040000653 [Theileria orientalis strain Shintoku]|uniref:Replication factor Mcm10 C-terminal domain-containing protein n=1 Tax=Theileria orientalis strain Shintoku TaxID=869250 RepID=J4DQD9_THEOR|nr:uncharacterized protein TOT_040000653 [Theileria orientalis strain Shintoku]BAM42284.1 uncharacterized protein TOT_040000653 [Theileria orientalis strain Shintoku]|eukprot:XP_009692585.1 uncharacterized protein TOT_040000653 [Theileria orientalis strain Shintoku]